MLSMDTWMPSDPWDRKFWLYVLQCNEKYENFIYYISCNPSLTMEMISNNMDLDWCWGDISIRKDFDINLITKKNEETISWGYMYGNDNINLEFLEKYIDKKWDWRRLSYRDFLTVDFINKYSDKNWDISNFSTVAKLEEIKKHMDFEWDFDALSMNKHITLNFIKKYPDEEWAWDHISTRSDITMSMVTSNLDLPWTCDIINNPNFTMDMVKKLPDFEWDDYTLATHDYAIEKKEFMSALKIQKAWKKYINTPEIRKKIGF